MNKTIRTLIPALLLAGAAGVHAQSIETSYPEVGGIQTAAAVAPVGDLFLVQSNFDGPREAQPMASTLTREAVRQQAGSYLIQSNYDGPREAAAVERRSHVRQQLPQSRG